MQATIRPMKSCLTGVVNEKGGGARSAASAAALAAFSAMRGRQLRARDGVCGSARCERMASRGQMPVNQSQASILRAMHDIVWHILFSCLAVLRTALMASQQSAHAYEAEAHTPSAAATHIPRRVALSDERHTRVTIAAERTAAQVFNV